MKYSTRERIHHLLVPIVNNGLIKIVAVKFIDFYNLLKGRPLGPVTGHFYWLTMWLQPGKHISAKESAKILAFESE